MFVMKRLERVAEQVVLGESKSKRLEILREQLRLTVLPAEFQLPLNPHIKVLCTFAFSFGLSVTPPRVWTRTKYLLFGIYMAGWRYRY
jgi:hypothetical protein